MRRREGDPDCAVERLRPLAREGRLPVAGGRKQEDCALLGFVEQLDQPRALDDAPLAANPALVLFRSRAQFACLALRKRGGPFPPRRPYALPFEKKRG